MRKNVIGNGNMVNPVFQRIKTPGIVKILDTCRGFSKRVKAPFRGLQQSYRLAAAYTQARQVLHELKSAKGTQTEFRRTFGDTIDYKHLVRYLGTVLATRSDTLFYRGRFSRSQLKTSVDLINYTLAAKFSATLDPKQIEEAMITEAITPSQVRYFSGWRDLFWSMVHFPFYGFYLRVVEPLAHTLHILSPKPQYDLRQLNMEIQAVPLPNLTDLADRAQSIMSRKYQYVSTMANAVIDLMKAAAGGIEVGELCFEASRLIVNALPFMTRSQLYRVKEVDGVDKAVAVAWAGKAGYHDTIVRAQAKLMAGKMVYDLVRGGPAKLADLPENVSSVIEGEVGPETDGVAELRYSRQDVSERLAGTSSLVALAILDDRPIICTDVKLLPDGTATATDFITGETIYPNPTGMRVLNVFEFFVAPFSGGALLGAVDLPKELPREEILNIMEAYQAYARILGMVIKSRLLTDNLAQAKDRIEKLAGELKKFAPEEAIATLEREVELMLVERNYVTVFADLSGSTRIDAEHRQRPAVPHVARNDVFDMVQRSLDQPTFPLAGQPALIRKYFPEILGRSPIWGEYDFNLADQQGREINWDYIKRLGDTELIRLWQAVNEQEGRLRCEAFGFMGDAILGGIGAGQGKLEPQHVKMMLIALVRTARRMVNFNRTMEIKYNLKFAVHGGFVSAGVLGSRRRGQYTLIGVPVDENARYSEAHQDWAVRAPSFGCRAQKDSSLPILVSDPMMQVLLNSPEGESLLRNYATDFNQYIMSGLLGEKMFNLLAQHLLFAGDDLSLVFDRIVSLFYNNGRHELLRGYKPLTTADLLKGPFDLAKVVGHEPRGLEGREMRFWLLEWNRYAYHPNYSASPDLVRRDPSTEGDRAITILYNLMPLRARAVFQQWLRQQT